MKTGQILRMSQIVFCTLVLSVATGCFSPGAKKVEKRTKTLQAKLAHDQYKEALAMCTTTAVWQRLDGKTAPVKYFFLELKAMEQRKSFAIDVNDDKPISKIKHMIICEMRQQFHSGASSLGNRIWQAKIFWEKGADGKWKVYKIQDVSKRVDKRS